MEPKPAQLISQASRRRAGALALACVWLLGASGVAGGSREGVRRIHAQESGICEDRLGQLIFPSEVLLGETVDIELRIDEICVADAKQAMNIVLVIDTSGSMVGTDIQEAEQAAGKFIEDLELNKNPQIQVGVVSFNQRATTLCELQNHYSVLKGCLDRLRAAPSYGYTDMAAGLIEAGKVLQWGRSAGAMTPYEAVILLSDGTNAAGCAPVEGAARRLDNVTIGTVCIGPNCDEPCLRTVASESGLAQKVNDPRQLGWAFSRLGRDIIDVRLELLTIKQILPKELAFVRAEKADPSSPELKLLEVDPESGTTMYWEMDFSPGDVFPPGGVGLSFTVRPRVVGEQPSGTRSELVIRVNRGPGARMPFPQGMIMVLQAPISTVAPPEPPTLTPTPIPPSATAPPPDPTDIPFIEPPVRASYRAYLPRLQRSSLDVSPQPLLVPLAPLRPRRQP